MKDFLRLGISLIALAVIPIKTIFLPLPANASENWVKTGISETNDVFSIESTSIKGNERFRYFWRSVVFGSPKTELTSRPVYSLVSYYSVDCKTFTYRDRTSVWYDQSRQVVDKFEYGENGKLSQASPGTVQESTLKFVCSDNRDIKPAVATNTPGVRGNNIDKNFIENYKFIVSESPENIKRLLMPLVEKDPGSNITYAKSICDSLGAGVSFDEIRASQASTTKSRSYDVEKAWITYAAISNVLATKYYCPEFATR